MSRGCCEENRGIPGSSFTTLRQRFVHCATSVCGNAMNFCALQGRHASLRLDTVSFVRHYRRRGRTVCRLFGVRHARAETDSSKLRVVTDETPSRDILRTNRNRKDLLGAQTRRAPRHDVSRAHLHLHYIFCYILV